MKPIIGVSINLFDGEELLLPLLKNVDCYATHVDICWQRISNLHRDKMPEETVQNLATLHKTGLIDSLTEFIPVGGSHPGHNETAKRNLSLQKMRERLPNMDWFMSIDVDEFYYPDQLLWNLEQLLDTDYDVVYCRIQDYYKRPVFRCCNLSSLFVPVACRIREKQKYEYGYKFPFCEVDPTRKMNFGRLPASLFLERAKLEMHHMTCIRDNIRRKIINSSAISVITNPDRIIDHYESWQPGMPALMANGTLSDVSYSPDLFGISEYIK